MTWWALAGGCAVFYALHGGWSTRVARRAGPLFAGWALFTFAIPILGVVLVLQGVPSVGGRFWPLWGLNTLLNVGALYLFFSALRTGDLGVTYPLLALTPLFVIPIEYLLLGELPGGMGLAGIVLIAAGVYLLNFRGFAGGLGAPFRALARDAGAVKMLAVAVLWSLGGTLDRMAVFESSPAYYAFLFAVALSVYFLVLLRLLEPRKGTGAEAPAPACFRDEFRRFRLWELALHGSLWAIMVTFQMEALTLAQASYVLSIKRTGSILAVLLGWLAFREGSLGPRLLGAAITVGGACLLVW